jgi:hypothetical protein
MACASTGRAHRTPPGTGVEMLALIATHDPAGLIIRTGMRACDEETRRSGIESRERQTATGIADVLKKRFQQEGWLR